MAMGTAAMTTSLDGFHATATAQRADELARALFDAVNDDDHARIDAILNEATLKRPADRPHAWHGKRGQHSEHLGYILAEMQYLQRAHPGARW